MKYEGEKLNNDNWRFFSFGFLAFAKTRSTDGIYDRTDIKPTTGPNSKPVKAWVSRNALAAADLIAAADKEQYIHLRGIEDNTHKMWATLELFHTSGDESNNSLALWNVFCDTCYTDYSILLW
ncbi:hypothetical protein B0H14DRAFT_2557348 [Mycena olivaceomarginata]|nr:hypothetical protein B0H14DRAFT_2557348 [Mycena olivaceomarginata]